MSALLRKFERRLWRRRQVRSDQVYDKLDEIGPVTADHLALEADMQLTDVRELLEDLLADAVISKSGDYYFINTSTHASLQ